MFALSLFALSILGADSASTQPALVVAPLRALGVPSADAQNLTEELRGAVVRAGRYSVVAPQDVAAINDELQEQLKSGCDATECIAEIGGALGAQYLIAGTAGKLGTRFVMTLKLIDIEQVRALRTASVRAASIEALVARLPLRVGQLLGVQADELGGTGVGTIEVGIIAQGLASNAELRVWADDKFLGSARKGQPVKGTAKAGEVMLTFRGAKGYSVARVIPPPAWRDALIGKVPGGHLIQLPAGERLRFDVDVQFRSQLINLSPDSLRFLEGSSMFKGLQKILTPELKGRSYQRKRVWGSLTTLGGAAIFIYGTGAVRTMFEGEDVAWTPMVATVLGGAAMGVGFITAYQGFMGPD